MLDNLFLIDIETVPQFKNYNELSNEWQTLWWEKISKTMPENISPENSYLQRAGILAEFGKIVCISTAYYFTNEKNETSLKIKSIYGDDEILILNTFITLCDRMYSHNKLYQFAGHNIKEFDIPYICRRMIINNLSLPDYLNFYEKKPWEIKLFDTLSWWKFGDYKNYITLHLLASVLGIPTSKTDMDGSMVQVVYYEEKNLRRIADYCQLDVIVTANIVLRFQNLPILNESNILDVQ